MCGHLSQDQSVKDPWYILSKGSRALVKVCMLGVGLHNFSFGLGKANQSSYMLHWLILPCLLLDLANLKVSPS